MSEELKPCPFCGGEGEMSFYAGPNSIEPAGRFVECIDCSAFGPSFEIQGDMPDRDEYTQAKARDGWNTRAPDLTERAAIVAWLTEWAKDQEDPYNRLIGRVAKAIEAGEHHDRG